MKRPNLVLLDVQGVGYEVHIPLTSFYELPEEGREIALKVYTHVREESFQLFGFSTQREKDLFLKLISISGIGPKLGIGILSGAKVEELAQAITEGDLPRLTSIPGIGRKTAERIVLELKTQVAAFLAPELHGETPSTDRQKDGLREDILSALVNLGYPRSGAENALEKVVGSGECERNFEDILRHTLRRLAG